MSQEGYRCRDPSYIAPPHSAALAGLPDPEGRGVILDRCPTCRRPGRHYCERMGRPCEAREEAKAGARNQYHREYHQRIRRESGWFSARARYTGGQPKPTHCLHGHELTPDNVRVERNTNGRSQRRCLECVRRRQRKPSYTLTSTSPEAST
jgi:hypothetical protein